MTLGLSGPAGAQSDKEVAQARQKFRQAISMQTGGNWAAALGLFREVAAVKNTPQVQFNIAICEENLGQLVQALGDYQLAAAAAREEGKLDVAAEVDSRLGTLKERIPKIVIKRGKHAGMAKMSIDGLEVGSAMIDKEMPVDPGNHMVEGKSKGYKPFEEQVVAEEGSVLEVVVELEELPKDEVAAAGPSESPGPDQGPATPKDEGGTNLVPWIVGGVGVAALAASGTFFILALSAQSDLEAACPDENRCDISNEGLQSKRDTFALLAPIALGVGVVGVGVGTVLLLTSGSSSSDGSDAASLDLTIGHGSALAGATLRGRF